MKQIFFSLFFIGLYLMHNPYAQAQQYYSYISDKHFSDQASLFGYNFKPNVKEIPKQAKRDIAAGDYSFGITRNNIYVEGEGIKGVYNVQSINPTEYGFLFSVMNSKDVGTTGHLKVIVKDKKVVALIFKKTAKDQETIFFIPEIPEKMAEQEEAFFTDKSELKIPYTDSLWNKTITPFFRIDKKSGIQDRLHFSDSTRIKFIEKVTTIEKKKKNKQGEEEIKEVKIIKDYSLELYTILHYADGEVEQKTVNYSIKKWEEIENPNAKSGDNLYKIIIITDKGKELSLYLNKNRSVNYFDDGEAAYLVRGY